ncbi:N-acyl homoserine lactonase family protein [Rhodospirillaceae bacterium]|nr:N-acyl homoserine lactonase family protein [Rhodospirillaceae bacterium]MBT6305850.1 N-acyl homoserine lactonase family protein [Rhodospirillaceae bacterium]MDC0998305.1 N-acyl homoserine lactonase family protein [Alphaproteobacteria bacterium]MDC1441800.1 N-acyl homoserine lactonase family protein [Rhodospirillaceae bacterium]
MMVPEFEVFAIKYGERLGTRGSIFMKGDPHDSPMAMDYYIWVIRNDEKTIVVDCGFDKKEGENRGRTYLRSPTEGLGLIGIDPAEVKDVIITHMHYDHVGNLSIFPNARFHVQDTEMAYVTGRAMTHPILRHSFVLSEVQEMVAMVYQDRAIFHDGDDDLVPGVTLHHFPGHARGLMAVRVNTKRGWIILASDTAHYYESLAAEHVFITHENIFEMLESYRSLVKLGGDVSRIVPGHDPDVLKRYPSLSRDLDGIVAVLHEKPSV